MRQARTVGVVLLILASAAHAADHALSFDFGPGRAAAGFVAVGADAVYTPERGYGFDLGTTPSCAERGGRDPRRDGVCTSAAPFFFSVGVPEGNYRVTVTLGDRAAAGTTTIKAESRRLMLENVKTAPGRFEVRTFAVNVRNSRLPDGGEVALKEREKGLLRWDDKLTLELSGARPAIGSLQIAPVDVPTVYLTGDSTVTDQGAEPWNSWGQMLTRFLGPGVAVANHAESGETLVAFLAERRLEKILTRLKAGDYLFLQFGHNDMKSNLPTYLEAATGYTEHLRGFVSEARRRGATPVLVTSVQRRTFGEDGKIQNSLLGYPDAVRRLAREEHVALVDLHAMTTVLYEALGPEGSKAAFVDGSHHDNYGSYEIAKCVVQAIVEAKLPLAKHVVRDWRGFDPARPDPVAAFAVPESPQRDLNAPAGDTARPSARE